MVSTERQDMMASDFAIGSEVRALDGALMRELEARDSPKLREFEPGALFVVTAHGVNDPKRMKVKSTGAGVEGWISCMNGVGRAIVVPAHVEGQESPLDAVHRLRLELGSGPKICILGGTSFQDPKSEELTKLLAQRLSAWASNHSVIITGGMDGVQKVFAQNCLPGSRLFNLLPLKGSCDYGGAGKDVFAGVDLEERKKIFALLGDCYVTIEGGPGVAKEAADACERGVPVIAMRRTGGASGGMFNFPSEALEAPCYAKASEWDMLGRPDLPIEQSVDACITIVDRSMQRVRADTAALESKKDEPVRIDPVIELLEPEENPSMGYFPEQAEDRIERHELITQLFKALDNDSKGRLGPKKLRKFAEQRGFLGDADDWAIEYGELCTEFGWDARAGVDQAQFAHFVNNPKDLTTNTELKSLTSALTQTSKQGAEMKRPWLTREKTKEMMKVKPREVVVPELFRLLDVTGAGQLHQAEMRTFASALGWDGSDQEFNEQYVMMCESLGATESHALNIDLFNTLMNSHSGCGYTSDEDLRQVTTLLRAASVGEASAAVAGAAATGCQLPLWLRKGWRLEEAMKTKEEHKVLRYLVDNSQLQSKAAGVGYRLSRNYDDYHETKNANWGEVLEGKNFGDGWLGVDCKDEGRMLFLPFIVRDCRILRPEGEPKKPGVPEPTYPGFMLGSWDYVAVGKGASVYADPMSTYAKRTAMLPPGEPVKVVERGIIQQMTWLRLEGNKGWAAESGKTREMSEVNFEKIDDQYRVPNLVLDPNMEKPIIVYSAPTDSEKFKRGDLHAGAPVTIKSQVQVLMPLPNLKSESWRVFLHISSDEVQGWICPLAANGSALLVPSAKTYGPAIAMLGDNKRSFGNPPPGAVTWVWIEEKKLQVYKYPGLSGKMDKSVLRGDFYEVSECCIAANVVWHRLADGGWIPERNDKGKLTVEKVVREPHTFIYLVKDHNGLNAKDRPTYEKSKTVGELRRGRKFLTTDAVRYKNGDCFVLSVAPKEGWVAQAREYSEVDSVRCIAPAAPAGSPMPAEIGVGVIPVPKVTMVLVATAPRPVMTTAAYPTTMVQTRVATTSVPMQSVPMQTMPMQPMQMGGNTTTVMGPPVVIRQQQPAQMGMYMQGTTMVGPSGAMYQQTGFGMYR